MANTLLLNADGAPVSVMPLSVLTWQDAIKYLVLEKADVLLYHDNWVVRSSRWETQVPSVMMLREYMKPKSSVRFSRMNIYLRDDGQCQYCSSLITKEESTIDHVLPISKGGKTSWQNCVAACGKCNASKADHTVGWKTLRTPYKPDYYELATKRKKLPFRIKYSEWKQFIGI
jgi:5-methylcytosine-specific restriction endonuclease McrA